MKIILFVLLLLASVSFTTEAFAQSGAVPPSADSAEKVQTYLRTQINSSQVITLASPFKIAVTPGDGKKIAAIIATTGYTILTIDVISPTTNSPIEEFVCTAVVGDSLTLTARAQGSNPLVANNLTKHTWPVNSVVAWRVTGGMFKWLQWQIDSVWAHGGGGGGGVSSVGLSAPNIFTVSGSPVTSSGTLGLTLANQTANKFFAGPSSGGAAAPTFRAMALSDLPASIPNSQLANSSITVAAGTGISVSGSPVSLGGTVTITNTQPYVDSSRASHIADTAKTAGNIAFNHVGAGTNANALLIGTGGSLGTSGSGTITATAVPASGITGSISNGQLANSSLTVTAGAGMSGGGSVALGNSLTLTNAGVTSIIAGTGISVSGATGAVTVTNAGYASPLTTLGDILYEDATPTNVRLAGNITSTRKFLSQTGTGAISAAPAWNALVSGDIPNNAANTSGTAATFTGNLTGDITSTAMATTIASNAVTTTKINNSAVTLAKIANAGASSVLVGSGSSGSGAAYSEITLGTGLSMSGTVLSGTATVSGANPSATIGTSAVNGSAGTFMRSDAAPAFGNLTGTVTSMGMATAIANGAISNAMLANGAVANLSGTNTGDQTITLTSDVTGSGTGSFATTIASGAVTLAKMANMATSSLIYRKTAGSGTPEVNTLATLKTDLGLTGTNSGDQTITLTGDVTGSGTGSFAATIAALAVTNAKIANSTIDLTAKVTGILPAANGGTGNGFTAFSGPATSTKTFTLPNASANILTDNALVTLAQGGTNANLTASNGGIFYSTASAAAILSGTATARKMLLSQSSTAPIWSTETIAVPGTSGNFLSSDGTNWTSAAVMALANGGTGQTTQPAALKALTPDSTGNSGKVLGVKAGGGYGWVTGGGGSGTVTSIDVSGGTTGLTTSGGPVTTSGTITLAGTLIVANGGTGLATLTNHAVQVGAGTSNVTQIAVGGANTVLGGNASADPSFKTLGVDSSLVGNGIGTSFGWNTAQPMTILATLRDNFAGNQTQDTAALWTKNTTASTAGVPLQLSGSIRIGGRAWSTTATAHDSVVDWDIFNGAVSGAIASSLLHFRNGSTAAGWTEEMSISTAGVLNVKTGGSYQINGTSVLNATTLGSGVTGSSLTSVGTITSGTWNGTIIALANGGSSGVHYLHGTIPAAAGSTMSLTMPPSYTGTITTWTVVSTDGSSGTCVMDIKRSGTSLPGGSGNHPALTSAVSAFNTAVTSWSSTALTAGDILIISVTSASSFTANLEYYIYFTIP
jgi:hypothetical protein